MPIKADPTSSDGVKELKHNCCSHFQLHVHVNTLSGLDLPETVRWTEFLDALVSVVNEAHGVCHRAGASTWALPVYLHSGSAHCQWS